MIFSSICTLITARFEECARKGRIVTVGESRRALTSGRAAVVQMRSVNGRFSIVKENRYLVVCTLRTIETRINR